MGAGGGGDIHFVWKGPFGSWAGSRIIAHHSIPYRTIFGPWGQMLIVVLVRVKLRGGFLEHQILIDYHSNYVLRVALTHYLRVLW